MRSVISAIVVALSLSARAAVPLSPGDELKTFQLADTNLVVELATSEPDVRAPVAITWDADGRMFVVEMTDYPSGPVSGRIRLLEDRDGDGRYERSQIFATNLAFPNGVMPWKNGVLVTAAPDIWFLADTNGDGTADVREKVLTGFAEGNQQLRVNGLFWGIDNWIYGCNGRSDGEVKWASNASGADVSPAVSLRRRDFRFRPDTKQFEAIAGNSQFGMGHDDWGNRFPVFNNMPIRHVVMEDRYLSNAPSLAGTDVVPNISPTNDGNRVFAITSPNLLIPQPIGFFTSACGPSIFRGTALPESYRGNYFVCEPVQNIVQRRVLKPNGSTFIAEYAHTNAEFLASSDSWFHGVFTTTGPDGALYIVDMYRDLVEHPHWVAPELRDKVDWRKGEEHGRIWRVSARNAKPVKIEKLSAATDEQLVDFLETRNGWLRDTAQRLLVERRATNQLRAIDWLTWNAKDPETRVCALHLASEFNPTNINVFLWTLSDVDSRVRETSLRLLEPSFVVRSATAQSLPQLALTNLFERSHDSDPRVRLQAAAFWSRARGDMSVMQLAQLALNRELDSWQSLVIVAGAAQPPSQTMTLLRGELSPLIERGTPEQMALLQRLAGLAAHTSGMAGDFTNWIAEMKSPNRLLLLASFIDARASRDRRFAAALVSTNELLATIRAHENTALSVAAVRIAGARQDAVRVLPSCFPLLNRESAEAVQAAVVKACFDLDDERLSAAVIERWPVCPKSVRRQIVALGAARPNAALALLDSVSRGAIPLVEVDASTRQLLRKSSHDDVKERAVKLFAASVSHDRQAVVAKYRPALTMTADRTRGATVFEKNCTSCHQMQGVGAKVGPDLSGTGQQPRETLLVQILDPSSAVLPDYVAYNAMTKADESLTG
ncbi:MAG TPA: PVC-type heme-binding CxxCH protein, partial [Candidatus Acidoferrum sp.]|nr:PVC-type heme-binding CxxCH protein [Candidatus Acidoferrum sp.]